MTHLWLGLSLAIAPTGAWIAVTGSWSWLPVILSVAVIFWVAAFDIIYSLQDIEFDRDNRIFSIPAKIGESNAMWVARAMHLISWMVMVVFGILAGIGWPYLAAAFLVGILLIIEHSIAAPGDFRKIGIAFFTMNGIISIVLYLSVLISSTLGTLHLPEGF
jgi:4-hydroxybenzoate polyprenyltransferase